MSVLADYPENCRDSILLVSDALNTDIETAYSMILLTACLYDLSPYQTEVADRIINAHITARVN